MSIKGVKLKSESFFSTSPGVLELGRENLRGVDSAPPVQIGLKEQACVKICMLCKFCGKNPAWHERFQKTTAKLPFSSPFIINISTILQG